MLRGSSGSSMAVDMDTRCYGRAPARYADSVRSRSLRGRPGTAIVLVLAAPMDWRQTQNRHSGIGVPAMPEAAKRRAVGAGSSMDRPAAPN